MGVISLARSLPKTLQEAYGSMLLQSGDDDADLPEYGYMGSEKMASVSGIILSMFSSSLTTSNIDGRFSGSSWQHLRARDTSLPTHSDG